MNIAHFIPIKKISEYYQVEISFLTGLDEIGLIEISTIESTPYIHEDKISDIEKMIRMYHDLDVNLEGIDIVFNLLGKVNALQTELMIIKNRLSMYER